MTRHELADAMIKGLETPNVVESDIHYIAVGSFKTSPCRACALGAALIGHYDGNYRRAKQALQSCGMRLDEYNSFAKLLDISLALAVEIELKHLNGMPIQQIAAWLKSSEGEGNHV